MLGVISEGAESRREPSRDCPHCPRLADFRAEHRRAHPEWHNAPVPSFGTADARLLIVGLAPGLRGANRTGRPFTGDYAGDLLYATLLKFGFANGRYDAHPADGLSPIDCRITNAARCVPPANKPLPAEVAACRPYLVADIAAMTRLRVILTLGLVAHSAVLVAHGLRQNSLRFGHGRRHALPGGVTLIGSYHCSRYNTNTRRLTTEMFEAVFGGIREMLDGGPLENGG
ncbi:MAG TPA: uracil-DNA glycosylase [Stellaceae bacterium]|nr:uracil-DNA glycosylase [Stellaceae bacterium]